MVTAARHIPLVLVLSLGVALAAPPALADAGGQATFEVTVIHASKKDGGVDPALKGLSRYLRKSFSGYDRFTRLAQERVRVAEGRSGELVLPDDKTLELKFLGVEDGFVKVHLALDGLETTVNVKDGGLFFQAGRRYEEGILVLAIRATTDSEGR
ncbi:MAG: hypothetical protein ACQEXJ_19090 [Myxococcota bacterium]